MIMVEQDTMPVRLFTPAAVQATVCLGWMMNAFKAVLPYLCDEHPFDGVMLQFGDRYVTVYAAGMCAVACRVPVDDVSGLTGDPASDSMVIRAETATRLTRMFRAKKVEGSFSELQRITFTVRPDDVAHAENLNKVQKAVADGVAVDGEALRAPAVLEAQEHVGLLPGDMVSLLVEAENDHVVRTPLRLQVAAAVDSWGYAGPLDMDGEALAAVAKSAGLLDDRVVFSPSRAEGAVHVQIGTDFQAVAYPMPVDDADLQDLHGTRSSWAQLVGEARR